MKGKCLETVVDLHETTEYKLKGREGIIEWRRIAKGVTRGVPHFSDPVQHLPPDGDVEGIREEVRGKDGMEGVLWKGFHLRVCVGEKSGKGVALKQKKKKNTDRMLILSDDTTVVDREGEINESKRGHEQGEERNNEEKEEMLHFRM